MTRTIRAALAATLLSALAVGCSSRNAEQACWDALTAESAPTGKPEVCEGIPQDDYDVLVRVAGIERDGLQGELDALLDQHGG
ncbi:hypothetical protein [Streptomyces spiramenti]|uniref:Secreted protein n=1 Tax=Streptomyces spiramenti TaxID=2720606 RepID=A0ABX1AJV0_9ACTN|nr:hypothetical protein [Streptomyces spiramenti]NJP66271.1 hypothetical protein [Streptomyces spiramenti]